MRQQPEERLFAVADDAYESTDRHTEGIGAAVAALVDELASPAVPTIKTAIQEFSWGNYGLDLLEDIDSDEWATALAITISRALLIREVGQ